VDADDLTKTFDRSFQSPIKSKSAEVLVCNTMPTEIQKHYEANKPRHPPRVFSYGTSNKVRVRPQEWSLAGQFGTLNSPFQESCRMRRGYHSEGNFFMYLTMVESGCQLKSKTGVRPGEKTQSSSTCSVSRFLTKVKKGWSHVMSTQQETDSTAFENVKIRGK